MKQFNSINDGTILFRRIGGKIEFRTKKKKKNKVRFTHKKSIGKVMGFDETEIYGDYNYDVTYTIDYNKSTLSFNNPINIHLNCIKESYFNEQEILLVYSFFHHVTEELWGIHHIKIKCKVQEKPSQLIYYSIKEKIKTFKVELKDKDGNNINLDKSYLKFHIRK